MEAANEMVLRGRRGNAFTSRFKEIVDARFESQVVGEGKGSKLVAMFVDVCI